jgi:hypothetical protein
MTLPFFNIVRVLCVEIDDKAICFAYPCDLFPFQETFYHFFSSSSVPGSFVIRKKSWARAPRFQMLFLISIFSVATYVMCFLNTDLRSRCGGFYFWKRDSFVQTTLGELVNVHSMGNIQAIQNSLRCSRKEFGWRMLSFRVVSCEGD